MAVKLQTNEGEISLTIPCNNRNTVFWTRELDGLSNSAAYHDLQNEYWEDRRMIEFSAVLGDSAEPNKYSDAEYRDRLVTDGPTIAILKASARDTTYQITWTAFNPLVLIQQGNMLSSQCVSDRIIRAISCVILTKCSSSKTSQI